MDDAKRFYAEVGDRIRSCREKRRLTQAALATRVALNRTSVTNIELGRQKILLHVLVRFAEALEVAPQELIPQATAHSDNGIPANLAEPARDFVQRVVSKTRHSR